MIALLLTLASAAPLKWTHGSSGATYDWSGLQRSDDDPWIVVSEDSEDDAIMYDYVFNFGKPLVDSCSSEQASAIELYEVFDGFFEVCEVIGRHEMQDVSLLKRNKPESGIRITYGGGTLCENPMNGFISAPRRTTFEIVCGTKQDDAFTLVPLVTPEYVACDTVFRIKSPSGCPVAYQTRMSLFWMIVFGGLLLILGYLVLGCLYNRCKHGRQGLEALPNVEFWLELKEKVSSNLQRNPAPAKSRSKTSYNTI